MSIYSRNSENNTSKYPDLTAAMPGFLQGGTKSVVLDCEAVAFDHTTNKILPFQVQALVPPVTPDNPQGIHRNQSSDRSCRGFPIKGYPFEQCRDHQESLWCFLTSQEKLNWAAQEGWSGGYVPVCYRPEAEAFIIVRVGVEEGSRGLPKGNGSDSARFVHRLPLQAGPSSRVSARSSRRRRIEDSFFSSNPLSLP